MGHELLIGLPVFFFLEIFSKVDGLPVFYFLQSLPRCHCGLSKIKFSDFDRKRRKVVKFVTLSHENIDYDLTKRLKGHHVTLCRCLEREKSTRRSRKSDYSEVL